MRPRPDYRAIQQRDGSYRWRLQAPNGRALGLSATSFDDPDATWQEFVTVGRSAGELVPSFGHPNAEVGWIWSAAYPDGRPAAVGARSYDRRATCLVGFQRFVTTLDKLTASS